MAGETPDHDQRPVSARLARIEEQLDTLLHVYEEFRPLLELVRRHARTDGTMGLAGAWRASRAARNGGPQ